ncbi:MAG TPA: hypothetical protein VJK71_03820 [Gemmatimonadales bacterium]|nr:hypothetical protein [Gemmatimonadales bacterium]
MSPLPPAGEGGSAGGTPLVKLMAELPRGPRRDGAFALWLTVRVAEDLLLVPPIPERAVRRRVAALEHRLSSLVLPAPLRRALVAALTELGGGEAGRERAALVLQQLIAPAREVLGADAGEALVGAAKRARIEHQR